MSEREELMALLPYVSDERVHAWLSEARRIKVTMAPSSENQPASLSQEDEDFLSLIIGISQESGGYTVEGSSFRK